MKVISKPWLALACLAACAQTHAASASAPETAPAIRPDRVLLLDVERAGKTLVAVGERGVVLRSDDDGGHWQAGFAPVTRTLSGVAFADKLHGVAVGHGGTVLRTADGGAHWTPVPVAAIGSDALLGVLHVGGDVYIAYGAFGLYIESLDGGASWERRQSLGPDFDRHISQVIVDGGALLMVGESGTLARSADGGRSWEKLDAHYAGSFFGALALGDGALLVYGMRGNVYRSADHGDSWNKVELGSALALMNGRRLDDGRVVLVGDAGLLAVSTDRGASFTLHKSARGKGIAQLDVRAGASLLVVGEGGVEQVRLDK